jgi:hypothetical protein
MLKQKVALYYSEKFAPIKDTLQMFASHIKQKSNNMRGIELLVQQLEINKTIRALRQDLEYIGQNTSLDKILIELLELYDIKSRNLTKIIFSSDESDLTTDSDTTTDSTSDEANFDILN